MQSDDVVVDADFSTTQATEILFLPIRACTVLCIVFLMGDPFDFKALMQIIPRRRFVGTHGRSVRE